MADVQQTSSSEVAIFEDGEIIVEIKDVKNGMDHQYRCCRNILRKASPYFRILLDPSKFREGIEIEARLQSHENMYTGSILKSPDLPVVTIFDLGNLPKFHDSTSTDAVFRFFLHILHEPLTTWPIIPRIKTLTLLAMLAIIADRFGAADIITVYLRKQKLNSISPKEKKSATAYQMELEHRQRLLVGMIFDFPQWVQQSSAFLIINGSVQWSNLRLTPGDRDARDHDVSWWDLPSGVEGRPA